MNLDWKYLVTTAVAVYAVITASSAKRQSAKVAKTQEEHQKVLDIYEHYPIVKIGLVSEGDRVKFFIENISDKNAVREYKISANILILVKDRSHVTENEFKFDGGVILPHNSIDVDPDTLNEALSDSLRVIKRTPVDKVHIVIRGVMEYYAPHPKSDKKVEVSEAYLSYGEDRFVVHDKPVVDSKALSGI